MAKKKTKPGPPADVAPDLSHIAEPLRGLAVAIEDLVPDPRNARLHDEKNLTAIEASLREFGQVKPIVVNAETRQIIAGNGTYLAARKLGWPHLAATRIQMTPKLQQALAIADNRTGELATWDDSVLDAILHELRDDTPELFNELALDELLEAAAAEAEPEADAGGYGGGQADDEKWQILVTCRNEADQTALRARLAGEGYECCALIV